MLSIPSKILESCVTDSIVDHVFTCNQLVTEYQWAYRKGHSTDLLLAHLTETWRRALDSNLVVGVILTDFQKAFDSISHKILTHKLEHNYGIKGNLLAWTRDYLSKRKQYTVVNGELSSQADVTTGVPQGSVLGPTLFALYTGDLPEAVSSASLYMYADDTTIYCIGESVDSVTNALNNAIKELEDWSSKNNLVPHPKKCEAMMLLRGSFTGPLNALSLCNHTIKWVTHARLLGVTIDDKLTWAQHISEVKKSFVNKLNLLKRSSFLSRNVLLDLYFKIMLPSVSYALPIWGSFTNKDGFLALESLHCRAAKLIYGLTRDMPTTEVLKTAKWDSLYFMYKVKLATLAYKIFHDCTPPSMGHILTRKTSPIHHLRTANTVTVPRFNTYFMKNSIAFRSSIVWNPLTPDLAKTSSSKNYTRMASKSDKLRNLDFQAESPQTMFHNNDNDYLYY